MRWLRRVTVGRCGKRINCVNPRGHCGPCQERKGGKLIFVDEDGNALPEVTAPSKVTSNDPFGWNK